MFRFKCVKCGRSLKASEEQIGKKTKCSACGERFRIPSPAAEDAVTVGAVATVGAAVGGGGDLGVGAGGHPDSDRTNVDADASPPDAPDSSPAVQAKPTDNHQAPAAKRPSQPASKPAPKAVVRPDTGAPAVADPDGRIRVFCACGKKFKTRQGDVAGRIKCTACGKDVVVPARESAPAADAEVRPGAKPEAAPEAKSPKAAEPPPPVADAAGVDAIDADDALSEPKSGQPAAEAPAADTPSGEGMVGEPDDQGRIKIVCSCGKKFRTKMGDVAGRIKCSKCGKKITVPARPGAPVVDPVEEFLREAAAERAGADAPPAAEPASAPAAKTPSAEKPAGKVPPEDKAKSASGLFGVDELLQDFAGPAKAASSQTKPAEEAAAPTSRADASNMVSSSGLFEVSDLLAAARQSADRDAKADKDSERERSPEPAARTPDPKRIDLTADVGDARASAHAELAEKPRATATAAEVPKPARDETAKQALQAMMKAADVAESVRDAEAVDPKPARGEGVKSALQTIMQKVAGGGTVVAIAPGAPPRSERPAWLVPAAVAALLVVGAVGYFVFFGGKTDKPTIVLGAEEDDREGPLHTMTGHAGPVLAVAYSPDGRKGASGGVDKTVRIWNLTDGKELLKLESSSEVTGVAFSAEGARVAACGRDGIVHVWETETGKPLIDLPKRIGPVNCVRFSPTGSQLAAGGSDRAIVFFDVSQRRVVYTLVGHEAPVNAICFSADGKRLLSGSGILGSRDRTVRIWDLTAGKEGKQLDIRKVVAAAALAPDGATAALALEDKNVHMLTLDTGSKTEVPGHNDMVSAIAFSPDGARIITGGGKQDRNVRIWSVQSKEQLRLLTGHNDAVRSVAFSPGGRRALSGSSDGTVRLWGIGK